MIKVDEIIEAILEYNPKADTTLLKKAYEYSKKVHKGQKRKSGEPYLSHPIGVAFILTKLKMDVATITAGILHDTIEDTYSTHEEIEKLFGDEITPLVDGVTKISKIHFSSSEEKQAENFRKMILAMSNDIRVIIIKLADRLHNMRTLKYIPRDRQIEIATETKDIYAPIANRLGIHWIKIELEDCILRYLYPEKYEYITSKIKRSYEERSNYLDTIKNKTIKILKEANIEGIITGRPKHFYSIHNKMQSQNLTFEQLYDLLGLRIITTSVQSCYAAFGLIHSRWKPIRGKVKDYIAMPKANMYQSLHTSVVSDDGRSIEFQIRTEGMHKIAEQGIAAHWRYKEGGVRQVDKDDKWFLWLKHLMKCQQDLKNPREFLDTVKIDLFPDEVYVFTPKGAVKSFPHGAVVVDFAYSIHSEVGNRCIGATVNGKMVPLRYLLKNGDMVEIQTSNNHVPNKDWLKIVKTSKAKNRIRNWIREEQKERSITLGKEMLESELAKYETDFSLSKAKETSRLAKEMGFSSIEKLLANIGYGNFSINQAIDKIIPKEIKNKVREIAKNDRVVNINEKREQPKKEGGIKVRGVNDILIRFGKCCNPIPGDEIVGFITRGRGVSVHVVDCSSVSELTAYDTEKFVNVEWDEPKGVVKTVKISINTKNKPGLLAKISAVISKCNINISGANVQTNKDKKAFLDIMVDVNDLKQLESVISHIKGVDGVLEVKRSTNSSSGLNKKAL